MRQPGNKVYKGDQNPDSRIWYSGSKAPALRQVWLALPGYQSPGINCPGYQPPQKFQDMNSADNYRCNVCLLIMTYLIISSATGIEIAVRCRL